MSDTEDPKSGRIINEPMGEALSKRYLAYALSTITARALPDVRDGLKPVQRRILYAMRELRLNPDGAYRKCAKIVGEVMGNYH
ncbi:MAG: DNA gyrase subunit A, partial [Pseudomonadota bacterium]